MREWHVWRWLRSVFRAEEPRSAPGGGRTRASETSRQTTEPRGDAAPGGRVSSTGSTAPVIGAKPSTTQPTRGAAPPATGQVAPGRAGTAALGPRRRETVDLVIGLDFGTAATKVVIRSPFMPGQRAVAVSFGELGHSSSPYLLPTRLRLGQAGHLTLSEEVPGEWVTDLKVRLLDRAWYNDDTSDTSDGIKRASAYLALVLREARTRFLTAEREAYGRFDARWALNLGIPSAGYDDKAIRERFLRAARASWSLSWGNEPVTWDSVTEALRQEREPTFEPGVAIEVVPEVAAQAAGYARSTLRDPGLHLLVDVGASTFDVCGFVLHERDGQDRYELLTATVDPMGVLALHRQRLAVLRCQDGIDDHRAQYDPLIPVAEVLADYHPGCSCRPPDVDAEFSVRGTSIVMRHLIDLKRRRDPLSRRWTTGLPVFLCGGGSEMTLFRRLLKDADAIFHSTTTARGLLLRTLPRSENLVNDDVGDALFHRLSVAYGLSFNAPDIGGISPPHETPDVLPPPPPRRPGPEDPPFISKDQV